MTTLPNVISTKETAQVVNSEMINDQELMETEPAAEISPVATPTDMIAEKVDVEGEPAENSERPVAPPTDMMLSMTMPPDVISTAEPVRLDGGVQHDADGKDLDNIDDPKEFSNKNGPSIPVIDQMNKESLKEEMEGVAGLEKLQKRGLQNKQRLRARLSSLVAIGVFRQRSRRGQLMPRLG